MAVDVSRIPNNNKFDPVREAILQLQSDVQSGVSGVGSINGQDGLITITNGSNITVGTVSTTITIGLTSDISITNATLSGYLRGPATFVIDPAAHGDDTGTVVIAGNLQVDGTTTTINSTTLTVDDKNIVIASGAADGTAADGAGITIDGANATMTYDNDTTSFVFNKAVTIEKNGIGLNVENTATSGADTGIRIRGARNGQQYSDDNLTSYILFSNYDDNTTPNNYDLAKIGAGMYNTGDDTGFFQVQVNDGTALVKALDIEKNKDATFYGNLTVNGGASLGGNITIQNDANPSLYLQDTTNDVVLRIYAANNYVYFTADEGDAVASTRMSFRVDGSEVVYYNQNQDAFFANDVNAGSFIKDSGTQTQFLKADGSVTTLTVVTQANEVPISSSALFYDTLTGNLEFTPSNLEGIINEDAIDTKLLAYLPLAGGSVTGLLTTDDVNVLGTLTVSDIASDLYASSTYPSNSFLNFNDDQTLNSNMTTLSSIGGLNLIWDSNDNDSSTFTIWDANGDVDLATKRFEIDGNGNAEFVGDLSADSATFSNMLISATAPLLDFVDTNSFTDANDRFRIRAAGNVGQVQWYDDSASTTTTLATFYPDGDLGVLGTISSNGNNVLTTATSFGGDVSGTYNNLQVANDSHTHDGRYYTETESDARFTKYVDLTSEIQLNSYRRSVIALCNVDNTDPSRNSYSIGTLTFHRGNGLSAPVKLDIAIEKRYNTDGTNVVALGIGGDSFVDNIQYVTFDYGGNTYGGIEFYFTAAQHHEVTFYGRSNFDIFGLDYYNTNGGTVLNSEVYNSLSSANVSLETDFFFNNKAVFHEDYHPNADTWTTPRTITLGGDLTGSVTLDGSSDETLSAQVVNDSHTHDLRYYTKTESEQITARALGWVPAYSNADESTVFWNETEQAVQLYSGTDSTIGMAYKAIRMKAGDKVRVTVMVRSAFAATSGLYLRLYFYNGNLPDGKTHVSSASSSSSSWVQEDSSGDVAWYENSAIGTSWQNFERTYTAPADGYMSFVILNYSGIGTGSIYVKQPDIQFEKVNDTSSLGGVTASNYLRSDINETMNGQLTMVNAAVPFRFNESGHTGDGQWWRHVLDGGNMRWDVSTAGDGAFTSYNNLLALSNNGNAAFPSGTLVVGGGFSSGALASNKQGIVIEGTGGRLDNPQNGTERLPTLQFFDSVTNYGSNTATAGESRGGVEWYSSETTSNFPAVVGAIYSINENTYNTQMGLGFYTNYNQTAPTEKLRIGGQGEVNIVSGDLQIGGTAVIDSSRNATFASVSTGGTQSQFLKADGSTTTLTVVTQANNTPISSGGLFYDTLTGNLEFTPPNLDGVISETAIDAKFNGYLPTSGGSITGQLTTSDVDVLGELYVSGIVGMGVQPSSDYKLNMQFDNTNANDDFHFAQRIDGNFSGADNTTADREQGGIYLDIDSSADGDASNEHRLYGIYSDVRFTGFSDTVQSGYFRAESNNSTEKTAQVSGVIGVGIHDTTGNGGTSSLFGVYGITQLEDNGDVDNADAGRFFNNVVSTRASNVGNLRGVRSEVQIDSPNAITYGEVMGVESVIDNNEGGVPTGTNTYLFKGEYQGTRYATNAWGLYVQGDKHYLEGSVGIGTSSPDYELEVAGEIGVDSYIKHNGDDDTYFGFNGADSYKVRTGNGDRFVIGNNDSYFNTNLGIGTTSPVYKLDVRSSGNLFYGQTDLNNTTSVFRLRGNGGSTDLFEVWADGSVGIGTNSPRTRLTVAGTDADGGGILTLENRTTATGSASYVGKIQFYGNDSGTGASGVRASIMADVQGYNGETDLVFSTANASAAESEAMRIDQAGNVGIGITNPSRNLDVSGTIGCTSNLYTGGSISASATGYIEVKADQTDSAAVRIGVSSGSNEGFLMCDNSGAGHVAGDAKLKMLVYNSVGNIVESGRFTTTGLGLGGQTAPAYPLDVTGRARITDDLFLGHVIYHNGDTNTYMEMLGDRIRFYCGGVRMLDMIESTADRIIIPVDVSIANTADPAYALDVGGTIRASGDVIAYSDARVKENVKTIDNALDKVTQLRGVSYNKIGETEEKIGVIAQEIEKVLPQVVQEDNDGMKSVAYGNIVGVLIEAIKEQQKQIDKLKARLDAST